MIRIPFVILVLLSLVLGACKSDESTVARIEQPTHTPTIIPLSVGNKWLRSFSLYDTSGVAFFSGVDSIEVLRDTLARGSKWFILKMQGIEYVVANRPSGMWVVGDGNEVLWYKFPASPRDSFPVSSNTSYTRIPTIDTSIVVPAGRFSCYKYEVEGYPWVGAIGGSLDVKFISPDNGFVKNEFYSSTFTSTTKYLYSRIELAKLTLK